MGAGMKEKKSRISWYCILSVLLICNIIRLFQTSVWADECFTIQLVHNNFTGIVVGTMKDVHPPLYYLITKVFCMIGGYTLPVFRLSSLTPVVIRLPITLEISSSSWLSVYWYSPSRLPLRKYCLEGTSCRDLV